MPKCPCAASGSKKRRPGVERREMTEAELNHPRKSNDAVLLRQAHMLGLLGLATKRFTRMITV